MTAYFWVEVLGSGTGNVNDATHWSLISGGPGGFGPPNGATDDAIWDAGSFPSGTGTVTYNADFTCHLFDNSAVTNTPTFSSNSTSRIITITGNVKLCSPAQGLMFTGSAHNVTMSSASAQTIDANGNTWRFVNRTWKFTGGGSWVFTSSPLAAPKTQIFLDNGTLTLPASFDWRQILDTSHSGSVALIWPAACTGILRDAYNIAATTVTYGAGAALTAIPDLDNFIWAVPATKLPALAFQQGVNTGHIINQGGGGGTVGSLTLQGGTADYNLVAFTWDTCSISGTAGSTTKIHGNCTANSQVVADYVDVTTSTLSGTIPGYVGTHGSVDGGSVNWLAQAPPSPPSGPVNQKAAFTMGVGF